SASNAAVNASPNAPVAPAARIPASPGRFAWAGGTSVYETGRNTRDTSKPTMLVRFNVNGNASLPVALMLDVCRWFVSHATSCARVVNAFAGSPEAVGGVVTPEIVSRTGPTRVPRSVTAET